ncbi:MAG: ATP-grasp domain-containing protein [Flexilinea sp.]|nr:ATP-grasp domain-containing protein [Flexilinea sp.]
MERIRVMVTGVGGGGNGEQLVKALKMSDKNYYLIGADITHISKGLFLADKRRIMPPASDPNYIETLLQVCKEEGVQALFTGSEPELKKISAVQDEVRAAGIFLPMNTEEVIETCMDKSKTMDWLDAHGFAHPASVTIREEADLGSITKFPVVLKPSIGGGGSANAYIAQDAEELRLFGAWMLHIYSEFIVQEYVGNAECEYTVGVLNDMEGNLINSIAVKKNIMTALSNRLKIKSRYTGEMLVISNGISQGQIGRFPEVTSQCEEIAAQIGCRSAINIQLRFVGGKCYVFEINPRYSGTSSFRAMVGYNEPDIMIRKYLLGETIEPHFAYKEGYIMRGLDETFIANEELEMRNEA